MFKLVRNITRSAGLTALLVAVVGIMAQAPGASAASVAGPTGAVTYGKLNVFAHSAANDGKGIAGAIVTVLDDRGQTIAGGATDSRGFFSSYVVEGSHTVTVTAPKFENFKAPIKIETGKSVKLDAALAPARTVDPAPAPAASLSSGSEQSDPATGKLTVTIENIVMNPVALRGQVLVFDKAGKTVAKGETDSRGNFSTMLQAGSYMVVVKAEGFLNHVQQAEVFAGQATELKATLTRISATGSIDVR